MCQPIFNGRAKLAFLYLTFSLFPAAYCTLERKYECFHRPRLQKSSTRRDRVKITRASFYVLENATIYSERGNQTKANV